MSENRIQLLRKIKRGGAPDMKPRERSAMVSSGLIRTRSQCAGMRVELTHNGELVLKAYDLGKRVGARS